VETPIDQQQGICLTAPQIRALVKYGIQIEKMFGGAPQDIEWAIEKGTIKILQSRNITHL
jgi:phosphoenolpyruvate synthase/pyruvate phosphate dikinase